MGNCVYCKYPKINVGGGNRLFGLADDYPRSEEVVDFSGEKSLEDIRKKLLRMEDEGLHLIGSRGYVYHSLRMAEMVFLIDTEEMYQFNLLTRSGGLRARVMELVYEREDNRSE